MKHLSLSKEGIHGQTKGLLAALRQTNETAQIPSANVLWEMTEDDIEFRKKLIAQAINQYENHTNMDHAAMQLLRERCACLAHLVWEQQLHFCDLNDRALRHIEVRKKILNGNDTPIHKGVESIMDTMKQLQLSLTQRYEVISGILMPVDMITISDTMSKLKSALVEIMALNS